MANEKATRIKLVDEVEKYPLLYNYKLPEYSRNDLTEKAWTEISNETKLTVAECKEKWRNIRSTFNRSTKPPPSGSKTKKPYYLAEHLTFILPYVKPVNRIPNRGNIPPNPVENAVPDTELADNTEAEPEEQIIDEGPTDSSDQHQLSDSQVQSTASSSSTPMPRVRPKATSAAAVDAAMVKFLKNKIDKTDEILLNKIEKQMNHYFLSLLPEFADMNAQQIRSFKIKVLQLIDDIKTAPISGPSRNSTGSSSMDNSLFSPISSVGTPAPAASPPVMNYQSNSLTGYQNADEAMNYQSHSTQGYQNADEAMNYQSHSTPGYQNEDEAVNFSVFHS